MCVSVCERAYRAGLTQVWPSGCFGGAGREDRPVGVVVGSTLFTEEVGCCLSIASHAWDGVGAGIEVQQALVLQVSNGHDPVATKGMSLCQPVGVIL